VSSFSLYALNISNVHIRDSYSDYSSVAIVDTASAYDNWLQDNIATNI